MTGAEGRSRRELWDERHGFLDPIESSDPDRWLVEVTTGLAPGRALDLATGDGRNASRLARDGWDVTAVDFSSVALERAARAASSARVEVDWVLVDLLSWRPPRGAFDLVALVYLHLPADERRAVYAGAAEAVAAGGYLLVVGRARTNLPEGSGGPQDPAVLFSAGEIDADLVGFDVQRAGRVVREGADGQRTIAPRIAAPRHRLMRVHGSVTCASTQSIVGCGGSRRTPPRILQR